MSAHRSGISRGYADSLPSCASWIALFVLFQSVTRSTTVAPAPPSFQAPRRKFATLRSRERSSETRLRKAPVPLPCTITTVLNPAPRACPRKRSSSLVDLDPPACRAGPTGHRAYRPHRKFPRYNRRIVCGPGGARTVADRPRAGSSWPARQSQCNARHCRVHRRFRPPGQGGPLAPDRPD